ncbi:hypothetical protein CU018_2490 [Enterococcus faecium]|nr:hypothetical protein [Enterococcus faecium]MBK4821091.1 hypothetical protein [Enterococcus faecium]
MHFQTDVIARLNGHYGDLQFTACPNGRPVIIISCGGVFNINDIRLLPMILVVYFHLPFLLVFVLKQ